MRFCKIDKIYFFSRAVKTSKYIENVANLLTILFFLLIVKNVRVLRRRRHLQKRVITGKKNKLGTILLFCEPKNFSVFVQYTDADFCVWLCFFSVVSKETTKIPIISLTFPLMQAVMFTRDQHRDIEKQYDKDVYAARAHLARSTPVGLSLEDIRKENINFTISSEERSACHAAFLKSFRPMSELCGCAACGIRTFTGGQGCKSSPPYKSLLIDSPQIQKLKYTDAQAIDFSGRSLNYRTVKSSFVFSHKRYHLHPELVRFDPDNFFHTPSVFLCPPCHRMLTQKKSRLPPLSIANGVDHVWPARLHLPALSLTEKAILARHRVYAVTVKCRPGAAGNRIHLVGHVIAIPHDAPRVCAQKLPDILKSVLQEITVVFLGNRTLLRKAFDATRLGLYVCVRVHVLIQWFAVLMDPHIRDDYQTYVTPGFEAAVRSYQRNQQRREGNNNEQSREADARAAVDSMNGEDLKLLNALPKQIIKGALTTENDAETNEFVNIDKVASDDVAHVRTSTAPLSSSSTLPQRGSDVRAQNEREFGDCRMDASCVMTRENMMLAQKVNGTIASLSRELLETREIDGGNPINEFTDNTNLLTGAFPWLFLLGKVGKKSASEKDGSLSVETTRHLSLQFHNTCALDMQFLFLLGDQRMRHTAALTSNFRAKSNPEQLRRFEREVNNEEFQHTLRLAVEGDKAAKKIVEQKLLPLIIVPGSKIPNGPLARRAALSKLYAMVRHLGLPSLFWTISPDDVHNLMSVRLSYPTVKQSAFPATADIDAFLKAFESGSVYDNGVSGFASVHVPCDLSALTALCFSNPIAACETFYIIANNILEHLLKAPSHAGMRSDRKTWKLKGLFATPYGVFAVIEVQGRGSLHMHLLFWGTFNPALLQEAAPNETFAELIGKGLQTMFTAHLPRKIHIERATLNACNALRPRGTPFVDPPREILKPLPTADLFERDGTINSEWQQRINNGAVRSCVHSHSDTCHHPPVGEFRCRVTMPQGLVGDEKDSPCASVIQIVGPEKDEKDVSCSPATANEASSSSSSSSSSSKSARCREFDTTWTVKDKIDKPLPNTTSTRKFASFPVPARDKRVIQYEMFRPKMEPVTAAEEEQFKRRIQPFLDELDDVVDDMKSSMKNLSVAWFKRVTPFLNGLISTFEQVLQGLLPGNQAAVLLGAIAQARSCMFYLGDYFTKDSHPLTSIASALLLARRKVEMYPSTAADTGTPERNALYLLQVLLNNINGKMEMSATQAAAIVLGHPAEICSHIFCPVYVTAAMTYLFSRRSASDVEGELGDFGEGGPEREEMIEHADVKEEHADGKKEATVKEKEPVDTFVNYSKGDDDEGDNDYSGDDFEGSTESEENILKRAAAGDDSARAHSPEAATMEEIIRSLIAGHTNSTAQLYKDSRGFKKLVPQHVHYALRCGDGEDEIGDPDNNLLSLNLYEYIALVIIVEIRSQPEPSDEDGMNVENSDDDDSDDDAAASSSSAAAHVRTSRGRRQLNKSFRFHRLHPLYASHEQRLRTKTCIPMLIKRPPRCKPTSTTPSKESLSWMKNARHCAAYYLTLMKPWSIHDLKPGGKGVSLSWKSFCSFMRDCIIRPDSDPSNPQRSALVDRVRHGWVTSMSQGFDITEEESTLNASYRRRNCTYWKEKRPESDGTEKPPSWNRVMQKETNDNSDGSEKVRNAEEIAAEAAHALELLQAQSAVELLQNLACPNRHQQRQNVENDLIKSNLDLLDGLFDMHTQTGSDVSTASSSSSASSRDQSSDRVRLFCSARSSKDVHAALSQLTCAIVVEGDDDESSIGGKGDMSNPLTTLTTGLDVESDANIRNSPEHFRTYMRIHEYLRKVKEGLPVPWLFIHGGPGCGKTYFVNCVLKLAERLRIDVIRGASTAAASVNLQYGETLHCNTHLTRSQGTSDKHPHPLSVSEQDAIRALKGGAQLGVIDEISNVTPIMFSHYSSRFKDIKGSPLPFGGMAMIVLGDFYQIPPVRQMSMAQALMLPVPSTFEKNLSSAYVEGCRLLTQFEKIEFTKQFRAAKDPNWTRVINLLRKDTKVTKAFVKVLHNRVLTASDVLRDESWCFAPIILPGNKERAMINFAQCVRFARKHGLPVIAWPNEYKAVKFSRSYTPSEADLKQLYERDRRMVTVFVPGAPAYINKNVENRKGISNGILAKLHSLSFSSDDAYSDVVAEIYRRLNEAAAGSVVWITGASVLSINVAVTGRENYVFRDDEIIERIADTATSKSVVVVPISTHTSDDISVSLNGFRGSLTCTVFGVEPAFAITFHKVQGKTMEKVIVNLNSGRMTFEQLYVAITRVEYADDFRILNPGARGLKHLLKMKVSEATLAFLNCFDEDGKWKPATAAAYKQKFKELLLKKKRKKKSKDDSSSIAEPTQDDTIEDVLNNLDIEEDDYDSDEEAE